MATNETVECVFADFSGFHILHLAILLFCAVVIADCLIVNLVIWRTPALHTNTNILLASSTVCDVLLCVAFIAALELGVYEYEILSNFCVGASIGIIIISMMHVEAIAIDRYIHIGHPFYYMKAMTKGRILKILVGVWTIGLLYTFIPLVAFMDYRFHDSCVIFSPPMAHYFIGFTAYVLSIIAVFICYLKIACVAFEHKKAAIARRQQNKDTDSTVRFKNRAALRSVKFFAIMFGTFALCTFPSILCSGINQFYKVPNSILAPFLCLLLINSIATIFTYMFTNKEFLKALVLTCLQLKRCCCRNHH